MLTSTRTWETGPRLHGIANVVGANTVASHDYTYDNLNRRTRAALEDGSRWDYGYNDRNEVTSAARSWADQTLAAGQQFGYDYNCIGNRKTAQSGGNTNGANLRTTGYAVNSLNQYTTITNLGYADILGAALATNGVWVNGGLAERKGEYFRKELQVGNGNGPLWTNVTVASGGVTNSGGLIVPDDRQTLTYDLDGNLTGDGTWSYEWDAENRLRTMTMTNVAQIAHSNRLRLEFAYDFMYRRVQKVVKTWTGSAFGNPVTNRFVYDGWNLLAVLDPENSILESFTWGQDLSGTMNRAGGVGGLLFVRMHGGSTTNCFAGYDGNGNVTLLVNAGDTSTAARYEYSPFGETLRATGLLARQNPFRFSTKYADEESGLLYYGYRYYSPALGRWTSRDPAEERGGIHLYCFVRNSPLNLFDTDGRWPASLAEWAELGTTAERAGDFLTAAGLPMGGWAWPAAVLYIDRVNVGTSGALLGRAGPLAGVSPDVLNNPWVGASVAARLAAVSAVGGAARGFLTGQRAGPETNTENLALSFLQNARQGNSAYASLDAALLGLSIAVDASMDPVGTATLFYALLTGDAMTIAAGLPSYTALNAWDMLECISPNLEGL